MQIEWKTKSFDNLNVQELYQLLRLRSEVFVVEQNCVFLDMDNIDQKCFHLLGYYEGKLVAYSRLVPPGVIYKESSIGRVITSTTIRGGGAGKQLMEQSISKIYALFNPVPIKIGAQLYLKKFYESFAFVQAGDIYLEDGIEHIHMQKDVAS